MFYFITCWGTVGHIVFYPGLHKCITSCMHIHTDSHTEIHKHTHTQLTCDTQSVLHQSVTGFCEGQADIIIEKKPKSFLSAVFQRQLKHSDNDRELKSDVCGCCRVCVCVCAHTRA